MDDTARLKALRHYHILDTEPEQAFDDLTLLASHICGTPIALITLVDEDRQWFKSRVGISVDRDVPQHRVLHARDPAADIFIVPDALDDARFRDNPLVAGEPGSASTPARRSSLRTATRSARSASSTGCRGR